MGDFEIGYKKPPLHTRYKKGDRANPNGRGAKKQLRAGKIYDDIMNGPVEVTERGKKKRLHGFEYMAKSLAGEAVKGKLSSAELLIDLYHHSKKYGDYEHIPVAVQAWEKSGKLEITPDMSTIEAAAICQRLIEES